MRPVGCVGLTGFFFVVGGVNIWYTLFYMDW